MKFFMRLLLPVFLFPIPLLAQKYSPQPELIRLDQVLQDADKYVRIKESRIDSLRRLLHVNEDSEPGFRYGVLKALFLEADGFDAALALNYASESMDLAGEIGSPLLVNEARINIAASMITQAMTYEAINMLTSCDRRYMPDSLLIRSYHRYKDLYNTMKQAARNTSYEQIYGDLHEAYIDSLAQATPDQSDFAYTRARQFMRARNYMAAQETLLPAMAVLEQEGKPYGGIAYTLATNARAWGNSEDYEKYIALAAMSDIEHAVRENSAMYRLALHCHAKGDFKRAYRYAIFALKDAAACQSTIRTMRIGNILPIIHQSYNQVEHQSKTLRNSFLAAMTALMLMMLVMLFFLYRQKRKTDMANQAVLDANQKKDKYIRHFLNMTSMYINKLHSFRLTVKRKIQAGQTADLLTKNPMVSESELKDFYENFDQAFLHIYPDFVSEFNRLLRKDERFPVQDMDHLSPELRIVALIRFGINDNQRIASFLGYSINTIYTYRHKLKSKVISPDTLDDDIYNIGLG